MEDVESMMRTLTTEVESGTEKFDNGMLATLDACVGIDSLESRDRVETLAIC